MGYDFIADSLRQDVRIRSDVPHTQDVLNGREVIISGYPEKFKEYNHHQGDNPYKCKGTCALVSCQGVLLQFGLKVSETDVVKYAIEHGLCDMRGDDPSKRGGTSLRDQARVLKGFGLPAHSEVRQTLQDLATAIEQDRGIIIEVDAGILWNDRYYSEKSECPNHAIVVTGVARDARSKEIVGFYINDSGPNPCHSGKFIRADIIKEAWKERGGLCVLTDIPHGTPLSPKVASR